jgi:hypothetical protein
MHERSPSPNDQDNAVLNFESYQAQEAILNPDLPDWFKDKVVSSAIATITQIGESKGTYNPKPERTEKPVRKTGKKKLDNKV